jgi:hypothetical protein
MPMKVRNPHRRTGALLLLLLGAAGKPAIATSPGLPSDFDGDGKADVMWRSLATGNDVIWRSASNGSLQAVARVGDLAWNVVGIGDFNGDGRADVFWRNNSTGRNSVWRSADAKAPQAVAGVSNLAWRVAGIGDFNGDGVDDVFWRNLTTGANTIWRSADQSTTTAVTGVSDTSWRIVGTGDFDGDGRSDVFWRNVATGRNVVWKSGRASTQQATTGVSNLDWKVVAVGDFDGDGRSDVFWRNLTTGANTIWKSASGATRQTVTTVSDQRWQVSASADYDGDGRADLFWRNTGTGADTIWLSANSGTQRAAAAVADPAWVVVPRDPSVLVALDGNHLASGPSPFAAGCDGAAGSGTLYVNAEVEPTLVVNPLDANNLIGAWQQDRWSNGSARGIVSGFSTDGGISWTRSPRPFSRCGGGNAANGGDYTRVTDPWLAISPDGNAYLMALGSSGASFTAGSANAMLVSRSIDRGRTWSAPITLIHDGATAFNDKNAITADPTNSAFAFAVWDRLLPNGNGATWFSRTVNGGQTWESPRPIYDPGGANQTIGNLIVVLPNGSLVNLFTEIDTATNGTHSSLLAVMRSSDKGVTWSAPIPIAEQLAVGTHDPHNPSALVRDGADLAQIAVAPSGHLYVVWQDARFSGGAIDAIAMSRSTDGGLHWSTPTRVNTANVPAFTPSVHVRDDNTVGIGYYDFRSDTADTTSLLTDYWLIRSEDDGASWQETRVSAAFDLDDAPYAGGYFLGDYQALKSRGAVFVPFFVRTNSGDLANRTDVFAVSAVVAAASARSAPAQSMQPAAAAEPGIDAGFRERVDANLIRVMRRRPTAIRVP